MFCSRCTSVAWVPEREGIFIVSHSDGNLYVFDKVSGCLLWNLIIIWQTLFLVDFNCRSTYVVFRTRMGTQTVHFQL